MEGRRHAREVVVAQEDQPGLDPEALHRRQTVGPHPQAAALVEQRLEERLCALGRTEDLEPELARVARARDEAARDATDDDRLRQEAEVPQRLEVRVGQRREQLAGARALDLQVRQLGRAVHDLDVEATGADPPEVVAVGLERRDGEHPERAVAAVQHRAVAEHPPPLVAEGAVADLSDLQRAHVVREQVVGRRERVGPAERPLAERRLVPHADGLADRVVLGHRIPEVGDPVPPLPLGEAAAVAAEDRVERRAVECVGGGGPLDRLDDGVGTARRGERHRVGLDRRQRHLDGHDHGRPGAAAQLLVAGRQDLGQAEQCTRRGRPAQRAVALDRPERLAVECAAQATEPRLLACVDARGGEDRLLDVALHDAVPDERHVAAPRAAGAGGVRHDGPHGGQIGVPGREHDLAATAHTGLRHGEQRDPTVVDGLEDRLRRRLQDGHELVQRPDVELVVVAGLAPDAEHVHVRVAEEVARAEGLAQSVVEERDRAADQVRAPDRVHRLGEQHAESVTRLEAAGPQRVERAGRAVTLDGEGLGGERVGRVHAGYRSAGSGSPVHQSAEPPAADARPAAARREAAGGSRGFRRRRLWPTTCRADPWGSVPRPVGLVGPPHHPVCVRRGDTRRRLRPFLRRPWPNRWESRAAPSSRDRPFRARRESPARLGVSGHVLRRSGGLGQPLGPERDHGLAHGGARQRRPPGARRSGAVPWRRELVRDADAVHERHRGGARRVRHLRHRTGRPAGQRVGLRRDRGRAAQLAPVREPRAPRLALRRGRRLPRGRVRPRLRPRGDPEQPGGTALEPVRRRAADHVPERRHRSPRGRAEHRRHELRTRQRLGGPRHGDLGRGRQLRHRHGA
ncbi:MAG: hypothetical protein AVDCRST_MAG79-2762 [uncultured Thermoleophilia bacterium]|uniref:Uncharacterized protein n=1 Tax=uncultured Thermoleophilia bacterium TaxID=1497501 RepID=A0A6J4UIH3_9ACTN|nr:MAG: hypothetical protein AVDCRST_MAG79-2762 [uncultured Thermoleophilia bacterium]